VANVLHLDNAIRWWLDEDIRIVLIDSALYTPAPSDEFLADIPVGARVAMSSSDLTGKTLVNGVADADDYIFAGLSGASIEYVWLVRYDGSDATSRLAVFWDTVTGLPLTPTGIDVVATWNPSGVFSIT
jgi:hypothetical protein